MSQPVDPYTWFTAQERDEAFDVCDRVGPWFYLVGRLHGTEQLIAIRWTGSYVHRQDARVVPLSAVPVQVWAKVLQLESMVEPLPPLAVGATG
jgi:hypothetical protein